ncbi:MAG TPA: PhoH family protein [Gaiellaceae bacterium]|nr:PhoH family protein [Gaiellaceae bacterium]
MEQTLSVSNAVAAELAGISDGVLDALKERLACNVRLRGNQLTLEGDEQHVENARAVIDELVELVEGGHQIGSHTVDAVLGTLEAGQDVREVFDAVVWRHRGKKISPKTVTQKRYVDSIRRSTVTFGIGPAGTGKTYLAMALAVAALHEREVQRIILTRPAVEAGERLGFLPGDLMAKVDPYLRPLFDALYDMLDPDKANAYIERGTIEVAPLAFMRGRAQPLTSGVLTPDGFRPIGGLRVGDLVTGSDGRPTPVLGVYPQGRKEVFRLRTQDGASTLCCGEHLWQMVDGSVLETDELRDGLRRGAQYELPLLSAPVEFDSTHVPIDRRARGGAVATITPSVMRKESLRAAPVERIALLQGLLDGAGRASVGSAAMREQVVYLARSLGGVATFETVSDAKGVRHLVDVRLPGAGSPPKRFVDSIEPAGEAETVCIQVAAADSLYVTDDFLVTHNTLNDSFIILDEAQNTSPEQMQMFLTRLGFGSKIVVTGDITQIDLPRESRSGLVHVRDVLLDVEGIQFVEFGHKDVVRHKLVQRIVEAYKEHTDERNT